jgi:hypothetical protein
MNDAPLRLRMQGWIDVYPCTDPVGGCNHRAMPLQTARNRRRRPAETRRNRLFQCSCQSFCGSGACNFSASARRSAGQAVLCYDVNFDRMRKNCYAVPC